MPANGLEWPEPEAERGLHAYLHAARSHRALVAAVAAVTLLASLAWLAVRTPTYDATARLLVNALPQDDSTFLGLPVIRDVPGDPTRTMQTAASLLRSPAAAALTARRLGGGETGSRVLDAVQIEPEGQSNILDIVASAPTAARAKRMADIYAQTITGLRDKQLESEIGPVVASLRTQRAGLVRDDPAAAAELQSRIDELQAAGRAGDPTTRVAQLALLPKGPVGAPPALVAVLALFGGLILGSVAAMLIDLLTPRRLRDASELAQVHPVPALVRVPQLSHRQRSRLRTSPLALPGPILAAFGDLHLQLALQEGEHRVLLFTGPSTGDGRTTSVVASALELAAAGERVILIDLDLRRPRLANALGVVPDRTIDAALTAGGRLTDALLPVPGLPTVQLVAGVFDDRLAMVERARVRLPALLSEARVLATYVLIDCAPLGEAGYALPLVGAVDDVILVARCDHSSLAAIETTRDLLRRAGKPASGYVLVGGVRLTRPMPEPLPESSEQLPRIRAAG